MWIRHTLQWHLRPSNLVMCALVSPPHPIFLLGAKSKLALESSSKGRHGNTVYPWHFMDHYAHPLVLTVFHEFRFPSLPCALGNVIDYVKQPLNSLNKAFLPIVGICCCEADAGSLPLRFNKMGEV